MKTTVAKFIGTKYTALVLDSGEKGNMRYRIELTKTDTGEYTVPTDDDLCFSNKKEAVAVAREWRNA